jgi:hypothetical protein
MEENGIREMIAEDIPRILEMAVDFHSHFADKGLGYNKLNFAQYCRFLMGGGSTAVFVMVKDGEVAGTIAGIVTPWFMNFSQKVLTEQWWWVDPKYRGGISSARLLDCLIKWGKERGASLMIMVSIDSGTQDAVEEYYKSRGMTPLENHFIQEI